MKYKIGDKVKIIDYKIYYVVKEDPRDLSVG